MGRDVDEALRLVRAFQFVAEHGEVCPAGWTPGAATMIPTADGAVSYFEKQADTAPEDDFNAKLPALKSEAELTAAIAGPGPVVIDWYASWCGKCRQIAPHVDALVAAHKGVKVFKVDTDALPELAAKYNASVLPTFSFFKVWRGLRAAAHARAKCAPYRREASLRCRRCRATRRARWPKPSRASQSENRAHFADVTLCGAPSTLRLLAHRRQRGAGVSCFSAVTRVQPAMAQNIDSPLKGGLKRVDMDARLNAIHAPLPVRSCGGPQPPRCAANATLLTGCAALPCAAGGGQGRAGGSDQRKGGKGCG